MRVDHLELLFVFSKKENHLKVLKDFQKSHFDLASSCKASSYTLSKALDITKETSLTSNSSSNSLKTSWVIARNWLTEESPDLNRDWFGEIRLFSVNNVNISLKIRRWKILQQIGSKEAYRFSDFVCFLSYVRVWPWALFRSKYFRNVTAWKIYCIKAFVCELR